MKAKSSLSLVGLFILLTGCHVSSRAAVEGTGGRTAYNQTLQKTTNEQMLMNLVRLRFVDFPFFLDVNAITTQFSMGTRIQPYIPIPGFSEDNPASIGGEFSWFNTPTISYTPLQGQTFAVQLFRPIDLLVIQQLIYAGWDIDRVFRVCIQSIDDIPNAINASGPTPDFEPEYERFILFVNLLRYFQQRSLLKVSIQLNDKDAHFKGKGFEITFPAKSDEAKELAKYAKSAELEDEFYTYKVEIGFNKDRNVGIMPRSLMACMYYLSLAVEVPPGHECKCPITHTEEGGIFDWKSVIGDLLSIKYSKKKPENAFAAIEYKGNWFYIHEHDLQSKRTFVLLLQLYNLQSSSAAPNAPLLTLPLR